MVDYDDDDNDERRKRQAKPDEIDPDMQEVQSIWQEMMDTFMHGAKKIAKKLVEKLDREGEQQQPQSEFYN